MDAKGRLLAQREAQLALIDSIQQGLASALGFQAIVDLVGDKLREVFRTPDLTIAWHDEKENLLQPLYAFEHGKRLAIAPYRPTPGGQFETMVRTRRPQVLNRAADYARLNARALPGTDQSKSMIGVPIVSGDRVRGLISIEDYEREDAFGDSEVRLLTTIAASLGNAMQSARLFDETQRLLGETERRNAELAVINSIQEGVAGKLDFQAIVDLVGDKLREVLRTDNVGIRWYDEKHRLVRYLYQYEHGQRLAPAPTPMAQPQGARKHVAPIVANGPAEMDALGIVTMPGTDRACSSCTVPIHAGDRVLGTIVVEDFVRECAYGNAEVSLLSTIAASLGVALENARLFDETQRLLKETEQRAAELAVINSIQEGVAGKLDFQAIVDLVGDKLREVLRTGDIGIRWFDDQQKVVHYLYEYEHGERLPPVAPSVPRTVSWETLTSTREPRVMNTLAESTAVGTLPGTDTAKSAVMVPIIGSNRTIGSIVVENHEREHAFTESDVRLLKTVGSSMGVALENARLFDETQRLLKETEQRNAELAVINAIQRGMSEQLEFQAIIELVGDKLREVFARGSVSVRWFDPATGLIHYLYENARGVRQQFPPAPPAKGGVWDTLIATRRPVVLNTPAESAALGLKVVPGGWQPISSLWVPIIGSERVLGTVCVWDFEREYAYGEAEVRLVGMVAATMGIALENARLFDETQRRTRETAALAEVGRDISSTLDLEVVMDRIAQHARDLLHCDNSAIFLPDADGENYRAIVALGTVGDQIRETEIRTGAGIIGGIIAAGRPEFVNDTQADPRAIQIAGTGRDEDERLMVAPLLAGKTVKGAMAVWRTGGRPFEQAELEFLVGLSQQAAVAIENARLFNETRSALERLTATADMLRVISSSPTDVQPVFDAIVVTASKLLPSMFTAVLRRDGDHYRLAARASGGLADALPHPHPERIPIDPAGNFPSRVFASRAMLHLPDWSTIELPPHERKIREGSGVRSSLLLPLVCDNECVGVLVIAHSRPHAYE
ncbi:MAG: GAF domain-containing protein, partial [Rudaea sp.]